MDAVALLLGKVALVLCRLASSLHLAAVHARLFCRLSGLVALMLGSLGVLAQNLLLTLQALAELLDTATLALGFKPGSVQFVGLFLDTAALLGSLTAFLFCSLTVSRCPTAVLLRLGAHGRGACNVVGNACALGPE